MFSLGPSAALHSQAPQRETPAALQLMSDRLTQRSGVSEVESSQSLFWTTNQENMDATGMFVWEVASKRIY